MISTWIMIIIILWILNGCAPTYAYRMITPSLETWDFVCCHYYMFMVFDHDSTKLVSDAALLAFQCAAFSIPSRLAWVSIGRESMESIQRCTILEACFSNGSGIGITILTIHRHLWRRHCFYVHLIDGLPVFVHAPCVPIQFPLQPNKEMYSFP